MILIIYNQLNFFAVPLTKLNAKVNIEAQLSICGRVVFSKALNEPMVNTGGKAF